MFFSEKLEKHFNYSYYHSEITTVNIFMNEHPEIFLVKICFTKKSYFLRIYCKEENAESKGVYVYAYTF